MTFSPRDQKRLNKIMEEFRRGFEFINHNKGVVVFGSARTKACGDYYEKAYQIGRELAIRGYNVVTGAGGGIMEAANKGAIEAGGKSIGLNIMLPTQQDSNDYLTDSCTFEHFYVRKVIFTKCSFATIVCPGGYGTLDELFEQVTLLQNRKIKNRPLVLFGKDHYKGLVQWIKTILHEGEFIGKEDLDRVIKLTDDPVEAVEFVDKYYKETNPAFFL